MSDFVLFDETALICEINRKREERMKVLSLFSGIGAFEKALEKLGIPFELVGYCEIDKYASKSYSAIHDVPETMNLGDITKIDETALPKDIDLITYGFPCQDISLAGKQKGLFNDDGTQTRSGLFFEALRIIEETQPKIAIAENVKNLVGKKFNAQFQVVLASLEAAGYNNYWQVLNAKDYGIPQNRERVFIVSIRKDIDTGSFKFPEAFPLELRLKDMLEDEVDEKFYLSQKMIDCFNRHKERNAGNGNGFGWQPTDEGVVINEPLAYDEQNGYIRKDGCVGTLTTDGSSPKYNNRVVEPPEKLFNIYPNNGQAGNVYNEDKCAPCLPGFGGGGGGKELKVLHDLRIRKLTPKECFRLMGFSDEDFAKAEAVNSNTQLYKQAGNSIVVDVLAHIFTQLKEVAEI